MILNGPILNKRGILKGTDPIRSKATLSKVKIHAIKWVGISRLAQGSPTVKSLALGRIHPCTFWLGTDPSH